jgi:prolyl-tRNA synthetase
MGGSYSEEFHYLAEAGEDTLLLCERCGYASNAEKAVGVPKVTMGGEEHKDPITETIRLWLRNHVGEDVTLYNVYLAVDKQNATLYVLLTSTDNRYPNLIKLKSELKEIASHDIEMLPLPDITSLMEQNEISHVRVVKDITVSSGSQSYTSESNNAQVDSLLLSFLNRLTITTQVSQQAIHQTREHDSCQTCHSQEVSQPLLAKRSIEVGHTFLLGTKYTTAFKAFYNTDVAISKQTDTKTEPMQMGCYGIGVTRLMAAIVECSHDKNGIKWPKAVSPYSVAIIPFTSKQRQTSELLKSTSTQLYHQLQQHHTNLFHNNVIIDDRLDVTGPYKLKDATLMGIPFILVLGNRFLKEGMVEVQNRFTGEVTSVPLQFIPNHVYGQLQNFD